MDYISGAYSTSRWWAISSQIGVFAGLFLVLVALGLVVNSWSLALDLGDLRQMPMINDLANSISIAQIVLVAIYCALYAGFAISALYRPSDPGSPGRVVTAVVAGAWMMLSLFVSLYTVVYGNWIHIENYSDLPIVQLVLQYYLIPLGALVAMSLMGAYLSQLKPVKELIYGWKDGPGSLNLVIGILILAIAVAPQVALLIAFQMSAIL